MEPQKGCVSFAHQPRDDHSYNLLFRRHWHSGLVEIQSLFISGLLATLFARNGEAIALVQINDLMAVAEPETLQLVPLNLVHSLKTDRLSSRTG